MSADSGRYVPSEWPWFADHKNLLILVEWLADRGHGARAIVGAVETPWVYEAEFRLAAAAGYHEWLNASGDCVIVVHDDYHVHCGGTTECGWEARWVDGELEVIEGKSAPVS